MLPTFSLCFPFYDTFSCHSFMNIFSQATEVLFESSFLSVLGKKYFISFQPPQFQMRNPLLFPKEMSSFLSNFHNFFSFVFINLMTCHQCGYLWISLSSIRFFNEYFHAFCQIWEVFNHQSFKYFQYHFLVPFCSSDNRNVSSLVNPSTERIQPLLITSMPSNFD